MFEMHAEGLGFPEGPAYLPDGSVAFVDLLDQCIRRYHDGRTDILARIQGSPNGMRLGPDGHLYIANNGGVSPAGLHDVKIMAAAVSGRIQRIHLDGRIEDVITDLPGEGPWRPNDLIFAPGGQIVFTDPQNWEQVKDWSIEGRIPGYGGGRVFCGRPGQSATLLADCYGFPNGLAFHPDGSLLVAMTLNKNILKFPWHGTHVGEPEIWCQFDNGTAPDGILIHEERMYVAGSLGDKISVIDLDGRLLKTFETGVGSDPTNLAVGGGRLWVTLGIPGQLISFVL